MNPDFVQLLLNYNWRGNVRKRTVILADEETLTMDTLPAEFQATPLTAAETDVSGRSLHGVEKRQIELVLLETAGNKAEAARQLGICIKIIYYNILDYAL